MEFLYIVGLPKSLVRRLVTAANANEIEITHIAADRNDEGELRLVPIEHTAVFHFAAYTAERDLSSFKVLVLPYSPVPQNLDDELEAFSELGGVVERPERGKDGWPRLGEKLDPGFFDSLFEAFEAKFFPLKMVPDPLPSERFISIARDNSRFLVTSGALTQCDKVPKHRHEFLIKCADSCSELLKQEPGITLDEYFTNHGLIHAKTSNEKGTLTINMDGKEVYSETRETHLKQGDATKRRNAVRVYYHYMTIAKDLYVGILHAGPHPTGDMKRTHNI